MAAIAVAGGAAALAGSAAGSAAGVLAAGSAAATAVGVGSGVIGSGVIGFDAIGVGVEVAACAGGSMAGDGGATTDFVRATGVVAGGALQEHLASQGIGTAMHYPIPPHRQPALQGLAHGPLPLTEQLHREVLSLPLHPGLTHNEALRVIKAVNSF